MPTCLLVEDDHELRVTLAAYLEGHGWKVQQAQDALGATQLAVHRTPDIVVLDLGLPGGDGRVVLRRLRAMEATRGLPVVLVTGREESALRDVLSQEGIVGFLRKPLAPSELLALLQAGLDRGSAA